MQRLISYTENTLTDPKQLKLQIQKIKRGGVALEDEEHELGIRNIAAPVNNSGGEVVAVVSILGPSIRLSLQRMKKLAPILKQYALKISEVIRNNEDKINGTPISKQ